VNNGGFYIAYQVVESAAPRDAVLIPSWRSQIEHLWEEPSIARMLRRMASFARLVLFDRRGTGLSDRVSPPPPLEDQMDDVLAVMRAAGSERAALVAETEGTALAALFAATHPEVTTALSLYCPTPRILKAADYHWGWERKAHELFVRETIEHWGEGTMIEAIAPSYAQDQRLREWIARHERLTLSPGAIEPLLHMVDKTDVRAVLPLIRVPTLVMRRRGDRLFDEGHARYVADAIPGARYVELPGEDSLIFVGDTDALLDEIQDLLTGERTGPQPERGLSTVLFTDICDSTSRAAELGDRRWGYLLQGHHASMRDELRRYGGTEIKILGDGVLATFEGPARAVRCALAVVEISRRLGLSVRAAIHTGECEREAGDVRGIAVHLAARVLDVADSEEVLVSRTVRDLVAGSGLRFDARGAHDLRGVPGHWDLYAASEDSAGR